MNNAPVSAFLRWAGSKKQLLPVLQDYWTPKYRRYVEPFAGSACLFFRHFFLPTASVLGDLNSPLIHVYRCLKNDPEAVIQALSELPKGKSHYKRIRSLDGSDLTKAGRAAAFIYLNRFCFNGLYRTNKLGRFNVPYGGERSGSLPSADHLRACSSALRHTTLVDGDFNETLAKVVRWRFRVPGSALQRSSPKNLQRIQCGDFC